MAYDFENITGDSGIIPVFSLGGARSIFDLNESGLHKFLGNEDVYRCFFYDKEICKRIDNELTDSFSNDSIVTFETLTAYSLGAGIISMTCTAEFHKKRGFLDTRLDSRTDLIELAKIFHGFNLQKYDDLSNGIRVYPIENTKMVVAVVPKSMWNEHKESLAGFGDNIEMEVLLFVDEKLYTTVGGYRYSNEWIVFRGLFQKDKRGNLNLISPRYDL